MERLLKTKRRGAASVLIILMLVVLVALGSFSITAANVNLKFSNKAIHWNEIYYDLDSMGENYLMDMDTILASAESKAIEYILTESYLSFTHTKLPGSIHSVIHYDMRAEGDWNLKLNNALNMVYFYYADQELEQLKEIYPDSIKSVLKDDDTVSAIITEINFSPDGLPETHLNVMVSVNTLEYNFENTEAGITAARSYQLRYGVESWREWQNPVDIENETSLWDGEVGETP